MDKLLYKTINKRPNKLKVDRSHLSSVGHSETAIEMMNEVIYPKYRKNLESICNSIVINELNKSPKSDKDEDIKEYFGQLLKEIPDITSDIRDIQRFYRDVLNEPINTKESIKLSRDTYRRMCVYSKLMDIL